MRTRTLVLLAAGGLVLGAVGTAFVLTSDHEDNKGAFLSLALTVGLSFLVSGVLALWRRPENRTGALLVAVAYFWFLGGLTLSNDDWVFTLGVLVNSLALGAFVHLLLGFPTGRLLGRRDVLLVIGTYALVFVGSLAQLLVEERPDATSCPDCKSMIAVTDSDTASTVVGVTVGVLALALVGAIFVIVVIRYLHARGALRRALGPVLGTGALVMLVLLLELIVGTFSDAAADPLYYVFLVTFALVPVAFLAGVLRSRLARAGVGDVLLALARGTPIRDALAQTSGRPDARDRVLAAGVRPLRLGGREAGRRGDRQPGRDARRARGPADGRDSPRSDPQGRAGAGRGGRRCCRPLAGQRAPAGQAARPARVPGDHGRHVAVPALLTRPRWPDREPEPRGHAARAATRIRRKCAGRRSGTSSSAPEERDDSRVRIRGGCPVPQGGRLRAHLREPNGQGGHGRLVDCAALRRAGQRPQRRSAAGSTSPSGASGSSSWRWSATSPERVANTIPIFLVGVWDDATVNEYGPNPAFEQQLGWNREDVTGRSLLELVHPDDRYLAGMAISSAANGVPSERRESRWLCKDGSVRIVAWSAREILGMEGRTVVLVSGADVTERREQEEEIRASRSRIVEAGDEARRRLERNLHDGAQQRLVALALSLRLAQSMVNSDPTGAEEVLVSAREELAAALDDLRELARGIHPAVLTDRGLGAAVEALAHALPCRSSSRPPMSRSRAQWKRPPIT